MGNSQSDGRRCGICFFILPSRSPPLLTPTARRMSTKVTYPPRWETTPLDEIPWPALDTLYHMSVVTSLRVLCNSVQRGCRGCAAILENLKGQVADQGYSIDNDRSLDDEKCRIDWSVRLPHHQQKLGLRIYCLVRMPVTGIEEAYVRHTFLMNIEHYGKKEYPHLSVGPATPAMETGYTGSLASMENLKTWVQNCQDNHMDCTKPASLLPYRILQLTKTRFSGKIKVRLLQDVRKKEEYACLSHRWDQSTLRCRTTRSNLTEHLETVPWTLLPKTFKQAMKVALELGLRYIWIDSLCILQGDTEDWKVQAARMCNIYQNAFITIAATSSLNSDVGMFNKISKIPISPSSCSMSQSKAYLKTSPHHTLDLWSGDASWNTFPLLTRGWVYQERLLSPRVIHFGKFELIFECLDLRGHCECGADIMSAAKHNHVQTLKPSRLVGQRDSIILPWLTRDWHQTVERFTNMDLTYSSDTLPALAGIARQHGETHRGLIGKYVAGLWESTLTQDLMWCVRDERESRRLSPKTNYPSWSWSSTTGSIKWSVYRRFQEDDMEVLSHEVELAGSDEYGAVSSGRMKIRGYLAPGTWKRLPLKGAPGFSRVNFVVDVEPEKAYPMQPDYDYTTGVEKENEVPPGSRIYCLKTGFLGNDYHVCLVLRAVNEEKRIFQRIGFLEQTFTEDVHSWFEEVMEAEILTLI